jgi:hypothetical protein
MRFLYSLCKAWKNGEFEPNLGIRVKEERLAREDAGKRRQSTTCQPKTTDAERTRLRREVGHAAVEAMRESLGVRKPGTLSEDNDTSA